MIDIGERIAGKEFSKNSTWQLFLMEKISILPVELHADYKISYIVFILGQNVV
jgi:hypothetical protein